MDGYQHIIDLLPYERPFLFVDQLTDLDSEGATGTYQFREDEFFYKGHFKGHPVTPGVILIETMAQIGLVCLGIHLLEENGGYHGQQMAFSSNQTNFFHPVYPGQKVKVVSRKNYFRLGKLNCDIELYLPDGSMACKGNLSGMVLKDQL